jgi:hypothetical protein
VQLAYAQGLAEYWLDDYDWRYHAVDRDATRRTLPGIRGTDAVDRRYPRIPANIRVPGRSRMVREMAGLIVDGISHRRQR